MPKVVGGATPASTRGGGGALGSAIEPSSLSALHEVAEMVKLLENTFRAVNIGLVNEIALMCDKL